MAFAQQYKAFIAPFPATGKTVELTGQAKSVPVRQVSKRASQGLHWSADTSRLHWGYAATLYTRELHDAFAALDSPHRTLGMPSADAAVLAGHLVWADSHGITWLGVRKIPQYAARLRNGGTAADAQPVTVLDSPSVLVVDGRRGWGIVTGHHVMNAIVAKALLAASAWAWCATPRLPARWGTSQRSPPSSA